MTMGNIVGGFKTTGIFPLNRDALHLPQTTMEQSSYLDCHSFHCTHLQKKSPKTDEFSEEEMIRYTREDLYDIPDKRYEAWVRIFHLEARTSSCSDILASSGDRELLSSVSDLSLHSDSLRQSTPHRVSRRSHFRAKLAAQS